VRTDADLTGAGWSDGQREAAKTLREAVGVNQVVLSLGHNMAQPNDMTAAMLDAIGEYVHDRTMTPDQGVDRLNEAIANAR
jgi:glucose/mannose transport system substrate-binding protein